MPARGGLACGRIEGPIARSRAIAVPRSGIIPRMNRLLDKLHPYPFERLRELTRDIVPSPAHRPISLGIGEPKHPTPELVKQALLERLDGLASYPATAGTA